MKSFCRFALLFFAVAFFSKNAWAQDCDNCPTPNVVIYGLQMNVSIPPPDDSTTGAYTSQSSQNAFLNWVALEDAIVQVGNIASSDPEASCVHWLQGSLAAQLSTVPDSMVRVHLENYWTGETPPAGALGGVDYLIRASIDSSGGSYHFHVYLEDGTTRDRIAAGEADFSAASGGTTAATSAIASIEPVFDKIRAYQKNLRDNDQTMALSANITVMPSQPNMDALQTIPITFQVLDCDGTPLKGRSITVGGSNGSFDNQGLQTDDNGEATANFTANNVAGVATITALYYPYTTPMHKQRGSHGSGIVTIDNPGLAVWQLDITESEKTSHVLYQDTVYHNPDGYNFYYLEDDYNGNSHFRQYALGTLNDTTISFTHIYGGSGSVSLGSTSKNIRDEPHNLIDYTGASSYWISKDETFTDHLDLGYYKLTSAPTFFFISEALCDGESSGSTYYKNDTTSQTLGGDSPISDAMDTYPTTFATGARFVTSSWSGSASSWTFNGQYSMDSVANVTLSNYEKWTSSASVNVHATVYQTPTSVKSAGKNIPGTYMLYDNFPNPFNPSTMISYDLPIASNVKLTVYDILGKQVTTLVNQHQNPGKYGVRFDASRLASGVYLYRLEAGNFVQTKKLELIK
jgi:hypothetical protein